MTKKEMKLIAELLKLAGDVFSNRGCGDVDQSWYNEWNMEEKKKLVRDYYESLGDLECFDENKDYANVLISDDNLMYLFSEKILQGLEK